MIQKTSLVAALVAAALVSACESKSADATAPGTVPEAPAAPAAEVQEANPGAAAPAAPAAPAEGAGETLKGIGAGAKDLFDSAVEGAKEVAAGSGLEDLVAKVKEHLLKIDSLATAEGAKAALTPLLDQIEPLRAKLEGSIPALADLKSTIASLETKFPPDSPVRKALEPILARIQALVD